MNNSRKRVLSNFDLRGKIGEENAKEEGTPSSSLLPTTWYECPTCFLLFNGSTTFLSHSSLHLRKDVTRPKVNLKGRSIVPYHPETRPCSVLVQRIENELSEARVNTISSLCLLPQNAQSERLPFKIKNEQGLVCSICKANFSSQKGFKQHMTLHKTERRFQCHLCDYQDIQKFYLKEHIRTRHLLVPPPSEVGSETSMQPPYTCADCGYELANEGSLRRHCQKFLHHPQPPASKSSGVPFQVFEKLSPSTTYHHGNAFLQSTKVTSKVICSVCEKVLSNKNSFRRHSLIHTGVEPFGCELCPMRFKQAANRQVHMQRKHPGQRRPEIRINGIRFEGGRIDLEKIRLLPRLEKGKKKKSRPPPHLCEECGRKFCNKTSLRRHTLIHRGMKPFHCDLCVQRFRQSHLLTIHKQREHADIHEVKNNIDKVLKVLNLETAVHEDAQMILGF